MSSSSLPTFDIEPLLQSDLVPPRFIYLDVQAGRWYPLAALPVIVRFEVRFTDNIRNPEVWSRLTSADFPDLPVSLPDNQFRQHVNAAFMHARRAPQTTTTIVVNDVTGGNAKRKLKDRFKFARVSATGMLDYVPDEREAMYHAIKGNGQRRSDSVLSGSEYPFTVENPVLLEAESISTADLATVVNFILENDTAKRPTVFPMDLWITSYFLWNPLAQSWKQVRHPGFYGFWDYTQQAYRLCSSVRTIRDPPLNTWWANRLCGMQTAAGSGFSFFVSPMQMFWCHLNKSAESDLPSTRPSATKATRQPTLHLDEPKRRSQGKNRNAPLAEQSFDLSHGPRRAIGASNDGSRRAQQNMQSRKGQGSVKEGAIGPSQVNEKKRKASSSVGYKGKGKKRAVVNVSDDDDDFINDGVIDYEDDEEDNMYA